MDNREIIQWDKRLTNQARRGWDNYKHLHIDLSTARIDQSYLIAGEFLYVEDSSGTNALAKIKLNRTNNDALDFREGVKIDTVFIEIFITNDALADEWLDVVFGINFKYEIIGQLADRLLPGLEPEWFNAVYDSADATGEGEIVQAATPARKIYIMSYVISVDIETWIKLQDEDSSALTGKFWLKAGGGVAKTLPPNAPLILNTVNKALEVIAEVAGNVSVTVTGYLAP